MGKAKLTSSHRKSQRSTNKTCRLPTCKREAAPKKKKLDGFCSKRCVREAARLVIAMTRNQDASNRHLALEELDRAVSAHAEKRKKQRGEE